MFTVRSPVVLPERVTVNAPVSGPTSDAFGSLAVTVITFPERTVSAAGFYVALPATFVTTHRYWLPSSAAPVAGVV